MMAWCPPDFLIEARIVREFQECGAAVFMSRTITQERDRWRTTGTVRIRRIDKDAVFASIFSRHMSNSELQTGASSPHFKCWLRSRPIVLVIMKARKTLRGNSNRHGEVLFW
jgi:hypothetical protein